MDLEVLVIERGLIKELLLLVLIITTSSGYYIMSWFYLIELINFYAVSMFSFLYQKLGQAS